MSHRLSALAALGLLSVVGCSSPPDPVQPKPDGYVAEVKSQAQVELTFYANHKKTGSCAGTLLSATTVLTAAHCVSGKNAAWVHAPYAEGDPGSWSGRATTLDWAENIKDAEQAGAADAAIVHLDSPIQLSYYPRLAATAPTSTDQVTVVQRGLVSKTNKKSFLGVKMKLRTAGGDYGSDATSKTKARLADTGGAVYASGRIVGLVSGTGAKTNHIYTTKLDQLIPLLKKAAKPKPVPGGVGGSTAGGGVITGSQGPIGNSAGTVGSPSSGATSTGGGTMCGCSAAGGGPVAASPTANGSDTKVTSPAAGSATPQRGTTAADAGGLAGRTPIDIDGDGDVVGNNNTVTTIENDGNGNITIIGNNNTINYNSANPGANPAATTTPTRVAGTTPAKPAPAGSGSAAKPAPAGSATGNAGTTASGGCSKTKSIGIGIRCEGDSADTNENGSNGESADNGASGSDTASANQDDANGDENVREDSAGANDSEYASYDSSEAGADSSDYAGNESGGEYASADTSGGDTETASYLRWFRR